MRCVRSVMTLAWLSTVCLARVAHGADPAQRFVRGDVDADRRIGISDAIRSLAYLFSEGEAPSCRKAADANDDGAVDLGDALVVLFYLFPLAGDSSPLNPPFPDCGEDAVEDTLSCESFEPCGHLPPPGEITNSIGLEFVYVPSGTFLMGSPPSERSRRSDELQHRVSISCGFYIGKYEVTEAQYAAVMGETPRNGPNSRGLDPTGPTCAHQNNGCAPNFPVASVDWRTAMEFCRRLSISEGVEYRLPTEAEWEYACRAGTQIRYSFGDALDCGDDYCGDWDPVKPCQMQRYIWWDCASEVGEGGIGQPVDGKLPNPWGIYGMHSNVGEWCYDWYGAYRREAVVDPVGPPSGNMGKVVRGPQFGLVVGSLRSAARAHYGVIVNGRFESGGAANIGLRVVQKLPYCKSLGITSVP